MKKLLLSLICLVSLSVFAQEGQVISDPNAVTRTLSGSFNAISVSSGIDLYLTQSDTESLAVSAAGEKYLDRFKTEIVDGTLKLYYDNNGVTWTNNGNRKLKAYVSFKTLQKLHGSAGSRTVIKGELKAGDLDLKFSSGAEFTGQLSGKNINLDQNSGSIVKISGTAEKLEVEVSSGAVLKSYDLVVDYCNARASSGGTVSITINKELSAKASSGGDIHYKGAALIRDVNISSGGSVKRS